MTDQRPENCTHRLRDEGKPAPGNGCRACGAQILVGDHQRICPKAPAPGTRVQMAVDVDVASRPDEAITNAIPSAPRNMAEFEVNHGDPKPITRDE